MASHSSCKISGAYSLSVYDEDENYVRCVKHYRIFDLDDGGCYITIKRCHSLEDLVRYYGAEIY